MLEELGYSRILDCTRFVEFKLMVFGELLAVSSGHFLLLIQIYLVAGEVNRDIVRAVLFHVLDPFTGCRE